MCKSFVRFAYFVLTVVFLAGQLPAQQDTGAISGTVFDSSNAVLPGATVSLKNLGTGLTRSEVSNSKGGYVFTPLPVGTYEITFSAAGFQSEVQGNLQLQVQQKLNLDVALKVGSTNEKITVYSAPVTLQTEDSSVGQVVDTQQIKDLPLNGRDVNQLVSMTPGTAVDANGRTVVSGQTAQNQYYGMDGVDNNNYSGVMAGGRPSSLNPSPDAVEEFKVQTGNYSAEFGQSAGGVVNLITKSGTNELHGVAYEYARNVVMDARLYFAQPSDQSAPYSRNQFGGTVGGPIIHNKLFFFADYESLRSSRGLTSATPIPSADWQKGDFSSYLNGATYTDTCTGTSYDTGQLFDPTSGHSVTCLDGTTATVRSPISYQGHPNVIDPSAIVKPAASVVALFPTPCPTCGGNYVWSPVLTFDATRGDGKVDYQWGQHDRLSGHYSINDQPSSGAPNLPGNLSPGGVSVSRQQGVILGDTHVFSANMVNELRYVWSHNNYDGELAGTDFNAATAGFGGIPSQQGLLGGLPNLNFSDVGASYGEGQWAPSLSDVRDSQISEALSLVRGTHSFKFGGAYNHYGWIQYLAQAPVGSYSFDGTLTNSAVPLPSSIAQLGTAASTGSGFAQFLYGISDVNALSSSILSDNSRTTGVVFAEDDWKATPHLTVNAGLRWEFGTGLHESQDRLAGIDLTNGSFMIPKSRQGQPPSLPAGIPVEYVNSSTLMDPHQLNFGPRFGFSYKLNEKTVMRGAIGVFFANPFPAGDLAYPLNPPFAVSVSGPNIINIQTGFSSDYLQNFNVKSASMFIMEAKPHIPTTDNWNLAIQRELPGKTSLEVAYAGSTSTHVNAGLDQNQPAASVTNTDPSTRRQFPNLGMLIDVANAVNGHYHSLQAKFEKRYSSGLTFLLAYTWAHSLDDAAAAGTLGSANLDVYRDPLHPRLDYGSSYFDIRHRVVLNGLYELPIGKGRAIGGNMPRIADRIVGGWQFGGIAQYQTGFHFSVLTYNDPSNADIYSYTGTAYPNVVGNVQDYSSCPGGHQSINCWFNTAAFAPSDPGQYGNERRNSLVGPANFDMDVSMIKSIPIHDKMRFQLRAEAFNATNHPNLGLPSNFVEFGNFGQITSVGSQREVQLAVRFEY
jgi:hypothetical protein